VTVEEDDPLQGLKPGRQDVQRLIYWNFAKIYRNEAFDREGPPQLRLVSASLCTPAVG